MTPIQKDFVAKIGPVAAQIKAAWGIQPRLLAVQAAHESAYGTSGLTRVANNLFGMTAGSWVEKSLPVVWLPTWEWTKFEPEKIRKWQYEGDILEKRASAHGHGTDVKVNRPFRAYQNWLASAMDWARMIMTMPRFAPAKDKALQDDVGQFAAALQACGYATDPWYRDKLVRTSENDVWTLL